MEKREKGKQLMGKKLNIFLEGNGAQYLGYTDYIDEIGVFKQVLDDWDSLEAKEAIELGGTADGKVLAKHEASDFWGMVVSTAKVYAGKPTVALPDLAKDLDQSAAEIYKLGDKENVARCAHFYTVLKDILPMAGTGIDLVLLNEGKGLTTAFDDLIGKPKSEWSDKSGVGLQIDQLIADRFEPSFDRLKSLTHGIYFRHKKVYVANFDIHAVIDDQPTEHTRVTLTVIDEDGNPIRFAMFQELKSLKKTLSDSHGVAVLEEFTAGKDTDFLVKCVGFNNYSFTKDIKTGTKVAYTITMIRIPVSPVVV